MKLSQLSLDGIFRVLVENTHGYNYFRDKNIEITGWLNNEEHFNSIKDLAAQEKLRTDLEYELIEVREAESRYSNNRITILADIAKLHNDCSEYLTSKLETLK